MQKLGDLFAPLIGQLIWSVRRGVGTFLTMEFGTPHLSIREPVVGNPDFSDRVLRNLSRRRIYIVGDWHLWVQYSDWTLTTKAGVLKSNSSVGTRLDECLIDLEGQRLRSANTGSITNSCILDFDGDATLEMRPSQGISDAQWSLYGWGGDIVGFDTEGRVTRSKKDPFQK